MREVSTLTIRTIFKTPDALLEVEYKTPMFSYGHHSVSSRAL